MVRDYFQDIVPPEDSENSKKMRRVAPARARETPPEEAAPPPDKSIRNINISRRANFGVGDSRPMIQSEAWRPRKTKSWTWILAALGVIAVAILALLFIFRNTTITIIPRSQLVTFDQASEFTAYPAASATIGSLTYEVRSIDAEESEAVEGSGTEHKETKASGSITVVNNYSASPVRLLKNTRFATGSGLIFRSPSEVVIPGRVGSVPGQIDIIVAAEKAGNEYNIGAGEKLTLPGLQSSSPSMYTTVYATTKASMEGGFSGEAPAVPSGTLEAAKSAMRARIETKAQDFVDKQTTEKDIALAPHFVYMEPPITTEGEIVRMHMKARVEVPVVPREKLASAVAQMVAASAAEGAYTLLRTAEFRTAESGRAASLGTDPLTFVLVGSATLVSRIDTAALAAALAGRDKSAFKAIVANFPGVDSAKARIEPFWKSTFPKAPGEITIIIKQPENGQ